MIKTFGLTHITLKVKDVKRSSEFYHKLFGTQEMYHSEGFIQIQTPGCHDIIVFEQGEKGNQRVTESLILVSGLSGLKNWKT